MAQRDYPTDGQCIFCRIVAGEIPCKKLHEDERTLAFVDINPLSRGHSLVIPKGHWPTLDRVPDDVGAAIGRVLPRLMRAIQAATGVEPCNVLQNNGRIAHQVVPHVHFHIIPRTESSGLGIDWSADKLSDDDAARLREQIASHL